jgi:hypothetical protein
MGKGYTFKIGGRKITLRLPSRESKKSSAKPGQVDYNVSKAAESRNNRIDRMNREIERSGMSQAEKDIFED